MSLDSSGIGTESIQLEIFADKDDYLGSFDQLEVWRSVFGVSGPYEELTANAWESPRLPLNADDEPTVPVVGPSAFVVGKDIQLKVDEKNTVVITFTGVAPLTYSAIAGQIIAQGGGLVHSYVTSGGVLVLEGTSFGSGATLRILGGEATPLLGLPTTLPSCLAYGKDPRLALNAAQEIYTFVDIFGSSTYSYRTRFRNRLTGATSEFSAVFDTANITHIDESNLVSGQLDLVGIDGTPLQYVAVSIHAQFSGILVDDKLVAGSAIVKKTDADGHVEFRLVRGQKLTVAIAGTNLVRDITVPTAAATKTFNLLDPSISGEDIFKVKVPDVIYAERRSL